MKRLGAFLVIVLALAFTVPAGTQAADDPVVIHQQMIDAVNRGDIPGAAKYLSDDVVIKGGFTCAPAACETKAAVQRELDTWRSQQVRVTRYSASSFVGELTSWEEHRANLVRAAGVDRVIVRVDAKFKNGKFVSYSITPDTRDQQTARFIDYVTRQGTTAAAAPSAPAAAAPAAPAPVPARLPSTGTGAGTIDATTSGLMALGIVVAALGVTGLAVARRRS
jgi:hypothetical protein